jgi:hypothetical protein
MAAAFGPRQHDRAGRGIEGKEEKAEGEEERRRRKFIESG